jgi:hypothetical protein
LELESSAFKIYRDLRQKNEGARAA